MIFQLPEFATAILSALQDNDLPIPQEQVLLNLCEIMFFATLEADEGRAVRFDVIYADATRLLSRTSPQRPIDSWIYVPFATVIAFTVSNIAKLAMAADARASYLVVYPNDKGELTIWGLIDVGVEVYKFRRFDTMAGHELPGDFRLSASGLGRLAAFVQLEQIAELRSQSLSTASLAVFTYGPVSERITTIRENLFSDLESRTSEYGADPQILTEWLQEELVHAIRRLLIRARDFAHGGAFLITSSEPINLDVKYSIQYDRLSDSIVRGLANENNFAVTDSAMDFRAVEKKSISSESYSKREQLSRIMEESQREVDGALWFVALLSRVDGLVLLDEKLRIKGFGVEIRETDIPSVVWGAEDENASDCIKLDYEHLGTRHRSMMRYIAKDPNALGFVISQDGDVRVMASVDGRLIVWKNVHLELDVGSGDSGLTFG